MITSHLRINMADMTSFLVVILFATCVSACHITEENDNNVTVRCNDVQMTNLEELSKMNRIRKLDLRNNGILSLKNLSIPEYVECIDLRGNQLTQLYNGLVQLFRDPKRHIFLSNNSFVCDCELIAAFKKFQDQIEDFQNITCADMKQRLQEISIEKLCREVSYSSAFIITAGLVFLIKIILLTWWYRSYFKTFLNRCCRCCCKSELYDTVAWQSVEPTKAYSQQDLVELESDSKP